MMKKETRDFLLNLIPRVEGIELENGYWVAKATLHHNAQYDIFKEEHQHYVRVVWGELYFKAVTKISELQMSIAEGQYMHFRLLPLVREPLGDFGVSLELAVKVEIFVSSLQEIRVPIIVYDERGTAIEWRCGYCSVPQRMEERSCVNCGAPRALLLQEMTSPAASFGL